MKTMQATILEELERRIQAAGFTTAHQASYANVGMVFALKGLRRQLTIGYDFQSTYCFIHLSGPAIDVADHADTPPTYRFRKGKVSFHALDYGNGDRLEAMADLVSQVLAGVKCP